MLFVEAKQNLDEMMMFNPHVKFAKSIRVKDTNIGHALMQQLEKQPQFRKPSRAPQRCYALKPRGQVHEMQ